MTTILCIIGASGSGKTTIETRLCRYRPIFHRIVSHTTRPMRPGEEQGREHIFCQAEDKPPQDRMLAYTRYGDYEYWADEADILQGKVNTYVIDTDGYHYLRSHFADHYDIRVLYIRRPHNPTAADRQARDQGRLTLLAEETDIIYNNTGTLLSIDLDMPWIYREILRTI